MEMTEEKKTTLTEEEILGEIENEIVYDLGAKTTCVLLVMKNGFEVIGSSACVDPKSYSREKGYPYARKRALEKVWELIGYELQTSLSMS